MICDTFINSINVTANCSNIASLPDISFKIGGVDYPLTANQYVVKLPDGAGGFQCQLGVQSFFIGLPQMWILVSGVWLRRTPVRNSRTRAPKFPAHPPHRAGRHLSPRVHHRF